MIARELLNYPNGHEGLKLGTHLCEPLYNNTGNDDAKPARTLTLQDIICGQDLYFLDPILFLLKSRKG